MPDVTPRPLLVFPCNGNAVEALDCLGPAWRVVGFIDDTPRKQREGCHGLPVMPRDALREWPQAKVLAVPGGPDSYPQRRAIVESLGVPPERFATVIHPGAHVSPRARLGRNVLVMAGVVVSGDAVISDHVCLLPNGVVHHDAVIGAWSLVGAGVLVAGGAVVGENCYLGSGTRVRNGVRIGAGALTGLGSVVVRDVAPHVRVAGCPARVLPDRGIAAAVPAQ